MIYKYKSPESQFSSKVRNTFALYTQTTAHFSHPFLYLLKAEQNTVLVQANWLQLIHCNFPQPNSRLI